MDWLVSIGATALVTGSIGLGIWHAGLFNLNKIFGQALFWVSLAVLIIDVILVYIISKSQ